MPYLSNTTGRVGGSHCINVIEDQLGAGDDREDQGAKAGSGSSGVQEPQA